MKKLSVIGLILMTSFALSAIMPHATAEAGTVQKVKATIKKIITETRTPSVNPNAPGGVRG